jgi:plastocyanin
MPCHPAALFCVVPLLAAAATGPATAQVPAGSVIERTPNMLHGWLATPATIQFNFVHRFTESGPPEHQISNSPTFVVAGGLPWRTTAGFVYATTSDVVAGRPNEWELFGRVTPFAPSTLPIDVALHVGYNVGAASADAELALARRIGPVQLLAAGRTFAHAFRMDERRFAVAGGASVRVARHLAIAGDVATLLERRADERIAWSAGLQIGVPTTPHTFSVHASNALTGTLQGVSRGNPRTRYGFEYTVPITLARWFPALRQSPAPVAATAAPTGPNGAPVDPVARTAAAPATRDTVVVDMRQLAYEPGRVEVRPGTTVVWTNNAPLPHTVTADDSTFDSGTIEVGRRWARTFTREGTYAYHCTPHPFMKGVVVVR